MGTRDCMTQRPDGTIAINCTLLPDKGFIDAVKTKEIANAKIMTRQDREARGYKGGEPDIILYFSSGGSMLISRKQLCSEYKHSSGNQIAMAILSSGKNYLVYKSCNERYKAFKIPYNCVVEFNGKTVDSNNYIICKVDESGNIDRNTITVISSRLFKKQFRVPMQAVIKRHMGGGKSAGAFKLFNKQNNKTNNQVIKPQNSNTRIDTSSLGMNPANMNIPSVKDIQTTAAPAGRFSGNSGVNTFRSRQQTKYKYTVIQKVVDINNKLLGFTIKDIESNQTKNISPQELSLACKDRLVDNVMLVRKDNGQAYLKGNGIRLESLPSVIL